MENGPGQRRVRYLDGLRGIACLQVLLLHVLSGYFPGFVQNIPGSLGDGIRQSPLFLLYNGWLAVFVFFVLSGYVLTAAYGPIGDTTRRIEARFLRLWIPAAAFGAIAVMMYFVFPLAHSQLAEWNGSEVLRRCWNVDASVGGVFRDLVVYPIFTGYNKGLLAALIPSAMPALIEEGQAFNPPVWTLSVEMIGSLLVMWLVSCRRQHRVRWLGSMLIASVLSPMLACFVAGHLAAIAGLAEREVLPRRFRAVVNVVLLIAGVYLSMDAESPIRLSVSAMLIFFAIVQSGFARRILGIRYLHVHRQPLGYDLFAALAFRSRLRCVAAGLARPGAVVAGGQMDRCSGRDPHRTRLVRAIVEDRRRGRQTRTTHRRRRHRWASPGTCAHHGRAAVTAGRSDRIGGGRADNRPVHSANSVSKFLMTDPGVRPAGGIS